MRRRGWNDEAPCHRKGTWERAVGLDQRELGCQLVNGLDAADTRILLALRRCHDIAVVGLANDAGVVPRGRWATRRALDVRIKDVLIRRLDVLGRNRRTIRERQTRAQLDRVGQTVSRDGRHIRRQVGLHLIRGGRHDGVGIAIEATSHEVEDRPRDAVVREAIPAVNVVVHRHLQCATLGGCHSGREATVEIVTTGCCRGCTTATVGGRTRATARATGGYDGGNSHQRNRHHQMSELHCAPPRVVVVIGLVLSCRNGRVVGATRSACRHEGRVHPAGHRQAS